MSRGARIPSATGYYHIVSRGNNKNYIFEKSNNKQLYKHYLFQYQSQGYYEVTAWCIMNNHIHLILYADDLKKMSKGLHDLNQIFAQCYHSENGTVGHVFQDRFISENIEDMAYLKEVIRYVHNNPVKAKMASSAQDYEWSSYNAYCKGDLSSSMNFVYSLFYNQWDSFQDFHQRDDQGEFLDIKEDVLRCRHEKAERIVHKYCSDYGTTDYEGLKKYSDVLDKLIRELIDKSGMSYENIAGYLNVPYSKVQRCPR